MTTPKASITSIKKLEKKIEDTAQVYCVNRQINAYADPVSFIAGARSMLPEIAARDAEIASRKREVSDLRGSIEFYRTRSNDLEFEYKEALVLMKSAYGFVKAHEYEGTTKSLVAQLDDFLARVESPSRCKHDVHGTDCHECFPSEEKK